MQGYCCRGVLAGWSCCLLCPFCARPTLASAHLALQPAVACLHLPASAQVWVYPSEQMFYNAMKRKGWTPSEDDMAAVVAIHNAGGLRSSAAAALMEPPITGVPGVPAHTACGVPVKQVLASAGAFRPPLLICSTAPFTAPSWLSQ